MNRHQHGCLTTAEVEKLLAPNGWPEPLALDRCEHAAACTPCRALLQGAREQEREFKDSVLPRCLPGLRAATESHPAPHRWAWFVGTAAATAAVAVLIALALPPAWQVPSTGGGQEKTVTSQARQGDGPVAPDTGGRQDAAPAGLKGPASLEIWVKRGAERFIWEQGIVLRPGDEFRVVPRFHGQRWLLVMGRDVTGRTQVLYPWGGTESGPMPSLGRPVPSAFALDEAPGAEEVVALASATPVSVDSARAWLAHGRAVACGATTVGSIDVEAATARLLKVAP